MSIFNRGVSDERLSYHYHYSYNLDENTRSKFLFYGGPDCLNMKDGLEFYIDSGVIPDFLGGPCSVSHFTHYTYVIENLSIFLEFNF